MAIGDITETLASREWDTGYVVRPDIIHVSGSIYAIVYTLLCGWPDYCGGLKTVSISDDGLTLSNVASLEWDTTEGWDPNIIHIAGSIYAIAYKGPGDDGWLKTVSISDDGLTLSTVASREWDTAYGDYPVIIHIAGSIYAIAYRGPDADGWLKTVSISDDGLTLSNVASLEFDTVNGQFPHIIHIAGSIYAIAYEGPDGDGWLKTVSISDDGLTLSNVASLEFDTVQGWYTDIIHIAGSIYAIAYEGPDDDGWLKTVSISDDGLTLSNVASLEFDTAYGRFQDIIHVLGSIYAIAYEGLGDDGWLKTVSISDDGLTLSNVASLDFDTVQGAYPNIIHIADIAGSIYAIAYTGPDSDGWLKTVGIITSEAASRTRFTGGVGGLLHRAVH